MGQVYSHLPHTEPSYPKQNRKEQKQRVSKSTAGESRHSEPRVRRAWEDWKEARKLPSGVLGSMYVPRSELLGLSP